MKQIVIRYNRELSEVALLEEGKLAEYSIERSEEGERAGSIHKGKVVNVLPGMQAAFLDIGLDKNAFLYIDDLLPANFWKHPADKPPIADLVKPGQELVVQVKKESSGSKGARVTTHFTLPGRWVVFMPGADYVAISRKIESTGEKIRLRNIGESLCGPGDGLIVRTVSEGQEEEDIADDFRRLKELWAAVQSRAEVSAAPCMLYRDVDIIPRLVRDAFTGQVDSLVIDDERTGREIRSMLEETAPGLVERVRIHRSGVPIFQAYPVEEELKRAFRRKVWLDSGGYLIVDQAEALTVIDVNTGKYTGTEDLEHTVFQTNMEAVPEIARLLRLRDLGGMIVADFIDMKAEEHRQSVKKRLEEAVKADRTKTIVVGWTKLGLMEMTRKKVRHQSDGLEQRPCPKCGGSGWVHPED